jgi:methylenetetrahydrofolate reductase (NADPH)
VDGTGAGGHIESVSFARRLACGEFAVALGITPPQRPLPGVLLRRARLLGEYCHAINVIQRPGRQASLDASFALIDAGIHPAWHLVTRGAKREEIRADIERAHAGGVRQLLCIRGDHAGADSSDTPTLKETIAMAAGIMPGAAIGATLNQYAPDSVAVMRNLLPKLRAGASYVQTQPVFEMETLLPLCESVLAARPETKIVAMAMPLMGMNEAERIEARTGVRLSDAFRTRLQQGGEEAAWVAFAETLSALYESDLIAGVAVMTFETDPSAEVGERIVAALKQAGVQA